MPTDAARRRAILAFWRAVERFEPPPVKVPERKRLRTRISRGWIYRVEPDPRSELRPMLPWEAGHDLQAEEIDLARFEWRHAVYGGVFSLDDVYQALAPRGAEAADHGGTRQEFTSVCAFVVDGDGQLVDGTIAFSSCAWAVGRIDDPGPEDPRWLDGWKAAVDRCATGIGLLARTHLPYPPSGALSGPTPASGWRDRIWRILRGAIEGAAVAAAGSLAGPAGALAAGAAQGATKSALREARSGPEPPRQSEGAPDQPGELEMSRQLRLPDLVGFSAYVSRLFRVAHLFPSLDRIPIVIRSQQVRRPKDGAPPAPPFLDSFLVEDLQRVEESRHHGAAIQAYLGSGTSRDRIDVRRQPEPVLAAVRPARFPLGCWPADPDKPLVLSQQFAVNQIMAELLDRTGLFSVNGPPGTGKTTMLRDLVAAIVVQRATELARFRTAAAAFSRKAQTWTLDGETGCVYVPGPDLTGYEIVVASSNNGAVENITAELPAMEAIGVRWKAEATYFPAQAEALFDQEAWGAVAVPLGKRANRDTFRDRFWRGQNGLDRLLEREEQKLPDRSWDRATRHFRNAHEEEQQLRGNAEEERRDPLADHTEPELAHPYHDKAWMEARVRVFLSALRLHHTLIMHTAKAVRANLSTLERVLRSRPGALPPEVELAAWQTLFLVVPVISTTFASCGRMFASLGPESLGWVLIDEAGQAKPQAAVGALWRAKRAVVVGDPLQLEPILHLPEPIQDRLGGIAELDRSWSPYQASAQGLADRANRWGTGVERPAGDGRPGKLWIGAPLRAHRRCETPMFTVSDKIAYRGMMVYGTTVDEAFRAMPSGWIDVPGGMTNGKWAPAEGAPLVQALEKLQYRYGVKLEQIRVLSPFTEVIDGAREAVRTRARDWKWVPPLRTDSREYADQVRSFLSKHLGTVHTMQGKESDVVILVLGAPGRAPHFGARQWAAERPNLLNVAASRARRRLYVIGDYQVWRRHPHFEVLAMELKRHPWSPAREESYLQTAVPKQAGPDRSATRTRTRRPRRA